MKLTSALLLLAAPLSAQTATTPKPAARPAGTATHTAACAKIPELSPKIPALAAGLPCAKHLYTLTTIPTVKVENLSPMEPASLKEDLGIESTSFSLDYVDTKVGTGQLAGPHSWYSINYTGYLVDGTKFDSSIDRGEPITIPYGQHQVIPGWDTGFAGMRVGGKRRLFIPYQLAYGAQGKPPTIPAKSELVFDVELVKISETPPPAKPAPAPPTPPKPGSAPPAGLPATAPPAGKSITPPPATEPPHSDPTKPTATPPPATPPPATPPATPPPTTTKP